MPELTCIHGYDVMEPCPRCPGPGGRDALDAQLARDLVRRIARQRDQALAERDRIERERELARADRDSWRRVAERLRRELEEVRRG